LPWSLSGFVRAVQRPKKIAREQRGGTALSVITVDSPVPAEVLEQLGEAIEADSIRAIELVDY
jgi:hypothetical protein